MRTLTIAAVLAMAGVCSPAAAVTNFTSNFDDATFAAPTRTIVSALDGWTGGAAGIEIYSDMSGMTAASGTNLIELDTYRNSSMSRSVDAGIYDLSFAYSGRPNMPAATTAIGVYFNDQLLTTASADGAEMRDTRWQHLSVQFTTAQPGVITFAALGRSDDIGGLLDDVALRGVAAPVPEAGEWAMMAAGLSVVGGVARRRRRAVAE